MSKNVVRQGGQVSDLTPLTLTILEWLALGWAFFIFAKYIQAYPLNSYVLFSIFPTQIIFPTFSIFLFYLKGLLLFGGILLGSLGYGTIIINKLKNVWINPLEKNIFSIATGHGFTSLTLLFLSSLHLLSKSALYALWLFGILTFILLIRNKNERESLVLALKNGARSLFGNENLLWVRLFLLAFLGIGFMMALVPELFYDALVYHLGAPNLYLQEGGLVHIPGVLSKVPMIWQILYLFGIGLCDEIIPKLIHWSNGLLLILVMGTFFKRFKIPQPGLITGLLFLSVPMVQMNLWTCGIDIGGALFAFLAVYALCARTENRNCGWTLLCAIFCAFSFSSKYQGGMTAIILLSTLLLFLVIYEPKSLVIESTLFLTLFGILILPWLLKNFWDTGNPLFPFLSSLFDKINLQRVHLEPDQWVTFINENRRFITSGIKELWSLPWKLTFKDSNQSSLSFTGPIFLAFLPLNLVLVREYKEKWLRSLLLFVVLFFAASFNSTHLTRYHLQGYPALLILYGASFTLVWQRQNYIYRLLLTIPLIFLLLENLQVGNFVIQNSYRPWDVLLGKESREEYRSYSHPGQNPYPANVMFRWTEQNLPRTSRTLFLGDSKPYNLKLPYLYSDVHGQNPITSWSKNSKTAEELKEKCETAGITHLFVNLEEAHRTYSYKMLKWDTASLKVFDEFWQKYAEELHRETIPEKFTKQGGLLLLYEIRKSPRGSKEGEEIFNPMVLLENLNNKNR